MAMEDFETRMESGKQLINELINQSINEPFEQAIKLWEAGYSLRIIQELTNIHRSKLSRYINEHNLTRDDDVRSQNRQYRVNQASKLHKMGFSKDEIANEMDLNLRTIDSYFKEIGLKKKTKISNLNN